MVIIIKGYNRRTIKLVVLQLFRPRTCPREEDQDSSERFNRILVNTASSREHKLENLLFVSVRRGGICMNSDGFICISEVFLWCSLNRRSTYQSHLW